MKKIMYTLLFSSIVLFSCSSDDDSNDGQMMDDDPQTIHLTLRVNGDGYSDQIFNLYRDTIEETSVGLEFKARDNPNNSIFIVLPSPLGTNQYSIAPYVNGNISVSSIILQNSGIYLSTDGSVQISDIMTVGDCTTISGSFTINYRRQDGAAGTINVQGTFEFPTTAICDE